MMKFPTRAILHRCLVTNTTFANQFKTQQFVGYLTTFAADIFAVKEIIFGVGIAFTIVLSSIFFYILRSEFFTTVFVWSLMIALSVFFVALCSVAYKTATIWETSNPQSHTDNEILSLRVASALFVALAIAWALVMLYSRKAIQLSIKIMSLTSECIEDMPGVLFTPIIQACAIVTFLVS
jgi:hypothetical protein